VITTLTGSGTEISSEDEALQRTPSEDLLLMCFDSPLGSERRGVVDSDGIWGVPTAPSVVGVENDTRGVVDVELLASLISSRNAGQRGGLASAISSTSMPSAL